MLRSAGNNHFLVWLVIAGSTGLADGQSVIRGISYGPIPMKQRANDEQVTQDDWMDESAKAMWGYRFRADLKIIRGLGANMIRLYGNNPENDHRGFLDEAFSVGLHVTAGMSDYPYTQMQSGKACRDTDFDCYSQLKEQYLQNLKTGFLLEDKTYHPALKYMNVINEPDLKMPPDATTNGLRAARNMCKAIISAIDGMLDAEKEAGLVGDGLNFTTSFSQQVCIVCKEFHAKPALGQIKMLEDAMLNPKLYDYVPKNDLAKFYKERWTHSFNTQNPAKDLQLQFFNDYERTFTSTPVFIGEYHKPDVDQTADLKRIFEIVNSSRLFLGISFFQYQVAYWKGSVEEQKFGMFGLGDYLIAKMEYFGKSYDVWCLKPIWDPLTRKTVPQAVAEAYGGSSFEPEELCIPSPQSVALDDKGYQTIAEQGNESRMTTFVNRVVNHLGAVVVGQDGLDDFAKQHMDPSVTPFGAMVTAISHKPSWTFFDEQARCVADRLASAKDVAVAIEYACGHGGTPTRNACENVPKDCKVNTFSIADYIFSTYYQEVGTEPLKNCYFGGAAILASSVVYFNWSPECVVGAPADKADVIPIFPVMPVHPMEPSHVRPLHTAPSTKMTTTTLVATEQLQDVYVMFKVLGVNYDNVTMAQKGALQSSLASLFASFAEVEMAAVKSTRGKPGTVTLSKGSLIIEAYITTPPDATVHTVVEKLKASGLRRGIAKKTEDALPPSSGATVGNITVAKDQIVEPRPPPEGSDDPEDDNDDPALVERHRGGLAVWQWFLLVALAFCCAATACSAWAFMSKWTGRGSRGKRGAKSRYKQPVVDDSEPEEPSEVDVPVTELPPGVPAVVATPANNLAAAAPNLALQHPSGSPQPMQFAQRMPSAQAMTGGVVATANRDPSILSASMRQASWNPALGGQTAVALSPGVSTPKQPLLRQQFAAPAVAGQFSVLHR